MSTDKAIFIVKKNGSTGSGYDFYVLQASASTFDELWLEYPYEEKLSNLLADAQTFKMEHSAREAAEDLRKGKQFETTLVDLSESALQLRTNEIVAWVVAVLRREGKSIDAAKVGMRSIEPDLPLSRFFIDIPVEDQDGTWNLSLCDERVSELLAIEAVYRGLRPSNKPGNAWMFHDRADPLRATIYTMNVTGAQVSIERGFSDDRCAECSGTNCGDSS